MQKKRMIFIGIKQKKNEDLRSSSISQVPEKFDGKIF